jgi:hypothetical protein
MEKRLRFLGRARWTAVIAFAASAPFSRNLAYEAGILLLLLAIHEVLLIIASEVCK